MHEHRVDLGDRPSRADAAQDDIAFVEEIFVLLVEAADVNERRSADRLFAPRTLGKRAVPGKLRL